MKKLIYFAAIIAAAAMVSCNKDNGGDNGGVQENPNPTSINGIYVVKSDIAVDPEGFNMLTDGGFERFAGDTEWKSKSLWYLPEWDTEAETAYNGSRTIYADCNVDGWRDIAVQSVCLKKNNSYTLTLNYRGAWKGLNCYMGFRGAAGHDVNTNNAEGNDEWAEYSYTYANVDDVKVDAFFGGWCWYDLWVEADDFKVIPTGTNNESFIPKNAAVADTKITNASFTEVASVDNVVAWTEDNGNIALVLNGAVLKDGKKGNFFASSSDNNAADGVRINVVAENDIVELENVVATAGVTVNGTRYVHYYTNAGLAEATEENPEPTWFAGETGILSSTDGTTWTKTAIANVDVAEGVAGEGASGNFVNVTYMKSGNYVYMYGSAAGDRNAMTYVARVAADKVGSPADYAYWDGGEWVVGDETAAAPIMYGPTGRMSVVYNADRYTYMMVYRSSTTGQLVYRDAGTPEGEWSGEKLLLADPDANTVLYAPCILGVENSALTFVASKM